MVANHPEWRTREKPEVINRYRAIRDLGRVFGNIFQTNNITGAEVATSKRFVQEAARVTNPPVWASYWDHVLLAPKLGKMIAQAASNHEIEVNTNMIEFLLWSHDLGTMVTPGAYLRKDLICERLLIEAGIPRAMQANLGSTAKLMQTAEKMHLDPSQYRWRKPLTQGQEQLAQEYFESQTPTQRICNVADNLGKRGPQGLFNLTTFIEYLKSQESRYDAISAWPSVNWAIPRREMGAFLQGLTVENNINWLRENGVDFDQIREQLLGYGAKFILVLRHGELYNPNSIVYNRDVLMKPDDIIHLADTGKEQMRIVGQILKQRGFTVSRVLTSPEIRARESTEAFLSLQSGTKDEIAHELDDLCAPGPYIEGMKMRNLETIGGNVYDKARWGQYHHELAESAIARMQNLFWRVADSLKVGGTGVMISHGDPIAWLMNTLMKDQTPTPENLRSLIYPNKGEGMVVVLDSNNQLFTIYSLNPAPKTKIY